MNRLYRAASILLVFMVGGCMSGPGHESRGAEDASELGNKLIRTMEAAFDSGNASALADMFAEDAVLLASETPDLHGRKAIRDFYVEEFKEYAIHVDGSPVETKIFGDHGYTRGTYTVKLSPKKGGASVVAGGRYLTLLQRQQDGTWRTICEMSNSDHP